ncbi:hypothetical protein R1flu_024925 [Riccia fluitans]|uniref:Uncharacterized protein n=1 Tax=Riccia fluitans TaxID=41844 RepID=A0ABD1XX79_9MARC
MSLSIFSTVRTYGLWKEFILLSVKVWVLEILLNCIQGELQKLFGSMAWIQSKSLWDNNSVPPSRGWKHLEMTCRKCS